MNSNLQIRLLMWVLPSPPPGAPEEGRALCWGKDQGLGTRDVAVQSWGRVWCCLHLPGPFPTSRATLLPAGMAGRLPGEALPRR